MSHLPIMAICLNITVSMETQHLHFWSAWQLVLAIVHKFTQNFMVRNSGVMEN